MSIDGFLLLRSRIVGMTIKGLLQLQFGSVEMVIRGVPLL